MSMEIALRPHHQAFYKHTMGVKYVSNRHYNELFVHCCREVMMLLTCINMIFLQVRHALLGT